MQNNVSVYSGYNMCSWPKMDYYTLTLVTLKSRSNRGWIWHFMHLWCKFGYSRPVTCRDNAPFSCDDPIQRRIKFKPASVTFKATHNEVPPYLSHLLIPYCPSHVFRSFFSSNLLQVPRTNLIFGSRSFRVAAPTVCNSLPDSIRSSNTLNSFRRHLKTHYFQAVWIPPSGKPQRLWFTCN